MLVAPSVRGAMPLSSPSAFPKQSICDRLGFAWLVDEVGLLIEGPEKTGGLMAACAAAVHSLQSGLASKNLETWAEFANLAESKGGNSLQCRLSGGASGIRTLGTVLSLQTALCPQVADSKTPAENFV